MRKDPETGKRISRPNLPETWQVVEVPNLRIIDDELWNAVQVRKKLYGGVKLDGRSTCSPGLCDAAAVALPIR